MGDDHSNWSLDLLTPMHLHSGTAAVPQICISNGDKRGNACSSHSHLCVQGAAKFSVKAGGGSGGLDPECQCTVSLSLLSVNLYLWVRDADANCGWKLHYKRKADAFETLHPVHALQPLHAASYFQGRRFCCGAKKARSVACLFGLAFAAQVRPSPSCPAMMACHSRACRAGSILVMSTTTSSLQNNSS